MTKTKRILIVLLALIGLALSIELCVVYYNANFAADAAPSICAINDMMDCDSVAKTSYSQFLGVPLSLWGVILYIFFLFMSFVDKIKNIRFLGFLEVFKNPASYIFCIALFSFIMSMILGGISVFKINSICIFCFMTYFIDLLIAIISKTKGISILKEVKISINDFIEAIKVKKYAISFVIVMSIFAGILLFTYQTNILSPQTAEQIEMKKYFKNYDSITDGNTMGPKEADVIIHEYIDYNCGGCFLANLYLHRIVMEFENVKVIQHNVPLERACNHNMQHEGHKNSCIKSKYALAAAKQNMYWQMSDILFEQSPENEKEIIEKARLLDFDIKKLKEDANSEKIAEELQESIREADSKGITGTPTFLIGMRKIMGIGSYPALKQAVIEQGGREKQSEQ